MTTALDQDIAAAGDAIVCAWEFGALHALADPLVWSSSQVQSAISAALAADYAVIPGPVSVAQGTAMDWFAAATLRVPRQSDGIPYSSLLASLASIRIGLTSATLLSADYVSGATTVSSVLGALVAADQGPVANIESDLQAAASAVARSGETVGMWAVAGLAVLALFGLGYSGLLRPRS